VTAGSRHGK